MVPPSTQPAPGRTTTSGLRSSLEPDSGNSFSAPLASVVRRIISACNKTCPCTMLASGPLYSEELSWPLRLFTMRYGV